MKQYSLLALGGTFDHFHKGHRKFLNYAFSLSGKVVIGITSKKMVAKKPLAGLIESFKKRRESVVKFLKNNSFEKRAKLVVLKNIYGPTLEPDSIEALAATRLTYLGAVKINIQRKKLNLFQLPIHVCPLVKSDDDRYISSARIRQGLISRSGRVYAQLFNKPFFPDSKLRLKMKPPQGKLLKENIGFEIKRILKTRLCKVALVGDSVVGFFVKNKFHFDYAAIDFKIGRQKVNPVYKGPFFAKVKNPAGQVAIQASKAIFALVKKEKEGVIRILGEEDLMLLPFVLSLPLGSSVFYGQPGQGIVAVKIKEDTKKYFSRFLT